MGRHRQLVKDPPIDIEAPVDAPFFFAHATDVGGACRLSEPHPRPNVQEIRN